MKIRPFVLFTAVFLVGGCAAVPAHPPAHYPAPMVQVPSASYPPAPVPPGAEAPAPRPPVVVLRPACAYPTHPEMWGGQWVCVYPRPAPLYYWGPSYYPAPPIIIHRHYRR